MSVKLRQEVSDRAQRIEPVGTGHLDAALIIILSLRMPCPFEMLLTSVEGALGSPWNQFSTDDCRRLVSPITVLSLWTPFQGEGL